MLAVALGRGLCRPCRPALVRTFPLPPAREWCSAGLPAFFEGDRVDEPTAPQARSAREQTIARELHQNAVTKLSV
jgi:hypothetical protein